MLDLPVWLKIAVPELQCPHCDQGMQTEGVLSIGVRRSTRVADQTVLFFEYECANCSQRSVVELNTMTLRQFVSCVFENEATPPFGPEGEAHTPKQCPRKRAPRKKKPAKSKITDSEVSKALKWIDECDDSHEFLLGIGLSQEEIDGYLSGKGSMKKPRRKRKKDE